MKYKMYVYDSENPTSGDKILLATSNEFSHIMSLMHSMENFGDVHTTKWEVTEWDDVVYSNKIKQ